MLVLHRSKIHCSILGLHKLILFLEAFLKDFLGSKLLQWAKLSLLEEIQAKPLLIRL